MASQRGWADDDAFDVELGVLDDSLRGGVAELWFAPRDLLERAFTDENYATLGRFMRELPGRLCPGGEALVFFGTSGDAAHLEALVESAGLVTERLAERCLDVRGQPTSYFVLRLHERTVA